MSRTLKERFKDGEFDTVGLLLLLGVIIAAVLLSRDW